MNAWINEFHYDNNGADTGEFIEVAVPAGFADLANLKVTLYNGAGGAPYPTGSSVFPVSSFTLGATAGGHILYSIPITGIQNGNPDGFALTHLGTVIQFLSYGGAFTAVGGAASGVTSVDIGIAEGSSTPVGASLGLTGTGSVYSDFIWTTLNDDTPKALNSGQVITVVPEPSTFIAGALLGLPFGVQGVRYLRNRKRA